MNHRREGDARQKRKIDDPEYGPRTGENDLFRLIRRRLDPQDKATKTMTDASVVSGQRTMDSDNATTTTVVTVPGADQNLEW